MGNSGPLTPFTGSSQGAAATLAQAIESGSDVEFDVALSTTPLGSRGNTAMYWIHVDHIVEVQVLLLQQLRPHSSRPGSSRASPHATPHRRISTATVDGYFGKEDDVGMIVLDQLEFFVPKQNASTVSASEGATGRTRAQAAGYVHWTGEEASVIVRGPEGGFGGLKTAIIKRKLVESFLDTPNSFADIPEAESYDANGKHGDSKKTGSVRQWLSGHKNIRPIAGLCSKRTRFVGLQNSSSGGIWATLDRDIAFKESVQTDLCSHEWASEARKGAHRFGHAVLEIRREGGYPESLIQRLDNSHLVQRVHGYSLETHAVWSCHKPAAMSPPVWISLLDQDLLKVPAPVKKRRRRQAATVPDTQSNSSRPDTSPSAASLTDGQSTPFTSRHDETPGTSASEMMNVPSLQAFRKKRRRPFAEYPPPIESEEPPQRQGYWNEYDNPESEDDGYYIYVDPDASMGFPGQEMFEDLARKAKRFFWRKNTSEQSPLLIAAEYPSSDDELETAGEPAASNSRRHNYGAIDPVEGQRSQGGYWSSLFRSFRDPARDAETLDSLHRQSALERQTLMARLQVRQHQGEMAKLQTYISCLGAAVVLDIVLCVLAKTSRRKLRGEVDVAIILGTLCNLLLLLTAVVTIQTRHDHIGWIHQGTVYIMVIGMVVVDILLFRWALNL
ncbi:hypothetical protein BU24DRAFT_247180 [Aaosphaeria arxii CBS 175.79]|uniref:VTC domain-containing protein n=1 Tax=Aaosphaeria arxii CBS 175.79 TaxID=1450172 RepID=A0A6A5XKY1_9PLEO|nr:uncharacterized protein BU24DRAFT_247180 [Aaosphaeria arxii CBS 175.79]KAF2013792.1 hypothetical protein BU24DRAFT_247180 [Aaosphaeria arxii CBS 175.79]